MYENPVTILGAIRSVDEQIETDTVTGTGQVKFA
jgi:hypothetical protein